MKNPVKILLFLLILPILIVFGAIVLLPVLLFLLVLILFMPSVRVFHLFQTPTRREPTSESTERTASEEVIDVECTVTEASEATDTAGQPDKQPDR